MKALRAIALLAFLFAAVRGEAAETRWDFLSVVSYGADCHHLVSDFSGLEMAVDIYGDAFGICDHCGNSVVGLGSEGETVTAGTIPLMQSSILAPPDFETPFYIIFQYGKTGNSDQYGWAELTVSEDHSVTVSRSAITDGPSILVGATPEPTSGLLLLVGSAMLLIRRRKP